MRPLKALTSPENMWGDNHFAVHRALEVAVGGGHHCLLVGAPGVGKSFLVKKTLRIIPHHAEEPPVVWARPQLTPARLLGSPGRPGEASLAHGGALVLDDVTAFPRPTLSTLARVLEEGSVILGRGRREATLPAEFLLLATAALPEKTARGDLDLRPLRYLPPSLVDRFHIVMEVEREPWTSALSESLSAVCERIVHARAIQAERFSEPTLNARMKDDEVRRFCDLDRAGEALFQVARVRLDLTWRGMRQSLTMARTVADLAGGGAIQSSHLAEALQYQTFMRAQPEARSSGRQPTLHETGDRRTTGHSGYGS